MQLLYAAPCVATWPEGADNGGATSPGVTDSTVKLVITQESSSRDSPADLKSKWQKVAQAWEHFYETWGRRVDVTIFQQSGSDEVAQRADAVAIASLRPFAVHTSLGNTVMLAELAARKIIVGTNSAIGDKIAAQFPGYLWGTSVQQDELIAMNAGDYVGTRLAGKPARWSGQLADQARTRSFGLIYPDTWDLSVFETAFAKHGQRVTEKVAYPFGPANATSWPERSRTIVAKLKSAGVTSIIAGTDLLITTVLTKEATNQQWFPEWVLTGALGQDLDLIGRVQDQLQWQHAFGVGAIPVAGEQPFAQDAFYNWYWGNTEDMKNTTATTFNVFAMLLYTGIHGAGPRLAPATFREGVFALPPAGGVASGGMQTAQYSFGRWGFVPYDDYNAFDDFDELYWDYQARGKDNWQRAEGVGKYRHLNGGRRYLPGKWPSGEPNMFDPAGTVTWYDQPPPPDKPPTYACNGCPSSRPGSIGGG